MRKNAACLLVLFLTLLVTVATITPARAADYTRVGVKGGDWAKYSFSLTGYPHGVTMLVKVVNVTAPELFLNMTFYNADGSYNATMGGGVFKVSVLDGSGMFMVFLITAAGLAKDDACYSGFPWIINDTLSHPAAGASRTCNHVVLIVGGKTDHVYWDQSTGILVSLQLFVGLTSLNVTMTSTNLWLPDIVTYGIIGGIGAVIVIAAVVLLHRRGGRGRK
nr:hypothetical protein [Candidatus Njordarchaeota archaeon]